MDKITRKKYNIAKNTFVGVDQEIYAYSIFCKYIHSIKQCMKRMEKRYYPYAKIIKMKRNYDGKRNICKSIKRRIG